MTPLSLPRLVGIAGLAGSGKDTAADYLRTRYGFEKYSLAEPIKAALNAMFGWTSEMWEDREWKERPAHEACGRSPRFLSQTLGTEWGRQVVDGEVWVARAHSRWMALHDGVDATFGPLPRLVIPDVRFQNEARWIREQGGVVVEVVRHGTPQQDHASEAGIPDRLIDYRVSNDRDVLTFLQTFRFGLAACSGLRHDRPPVYLDLME